MQFLLVLSRANCHILCCYQLVLATIANNNNRLIHLAVLLTAGTFLTWLLFIYYYFNYCLTIGSLLPPCGVMQHQP